MASTLQRLFADTSPTFSDLVLRRFLQSITLMCDAEHLSELLFFTLDEVFMIKKSIPLCLCFCLILSCPGISLAADDKQSIGVPETPASAVNSSDAATADFPENSDSEASELAPLLDDLLQFDCQNPGDFESPPAELEEANRLWLLTVLGGDSESVCTLEPGDEGALCVQNNQSAEANPNLTAETPDGTVRLALPAVKTVVQNFPTRRARLNENVVPQLFALLGRNDLRIKRSAVEILGLMGTSLTAEHRATARARLTALRQATNDQALRDAIDAALRTIPAE